MDTVSKLEHPSGKRYVKRRMLRCPITEYSVSVAAAVCQRMVCVCA